MEDTENHSRNVWSLLLFIWIHCSQKNILLADFNHKTLSNVLTILSPLNKVNVSLRLLVLKVSMKHVARICIFFNPNFLNVMYFL